MSAQRTAGGSGRPAAAILAGGQARRLGGVPKALLEIGGVRIIDRQLAALREVAGPICIVSADAARYRPFGVPVVSDALPAAGALGGIYTALVWSPAPRVIVVACDLPFLSPRLLRRLAEESQADVVVPRSVRGYEPLCAAWHVRAAGTLRRRIARGELKAADAIAEVTAEEIGPEALARCDPRGLLFVNVNTSHDYERAQELGRLESETDGGSYHG